MTVRTGHTVHYVSSDLGPCRPAIVTRHGHAGPGVLALVTFGLNLMAFNPESGHDSSGTAQPTTWHTPQECPLEKLEDGRRRKGEDR